MTPKVTTDLPKVTSPDELQEFLVHFVETHADWQDEGVDAQSNWRFGLDGSSLHVIDVSDWGDDGLPIQGSVSAEIVPRRKRDGYALGFGRPAQFLEVGWELIGFSTQKTYNGKHWVHKRTAQIEVNG